MLIAVKITTILTFVFSFVLGLYTLWINPKSKVNRLWFLMCTGVCIWSFGYLLTLFTGYKEFAHISLKIDYTGATVITVLFYHFVLSFCFKKENYLLLLGYIIIPLFLFLFYFTTFFLKGVNFLNDFGYYEDIRLPHFYIFLIFFFTFLIASLYLLYKNFLISEGIRRRQLFYMLLATLIGFGGGVSNFITDFFGIYPYGQMIVFLYPILISYGIFLTGVKIRR